MRSTVKHGSNQRAAGFQKSLFYFDTFAMFKHNANSDKRGKQASAKQFLSPSYVKILIGLYFLILINCSTC